MSDFLDSVVEHTLGIEPTLRPLAPSRFEPLRAAAFLNVEHPIDDTDSSPSPAELKALPINGAPAPGPESFERNSPQDDPQAVQDRKPDSPLPAFAANRPLLNVESLPDVVRSHPAQIPQFGDDNDGDWLHRRLDDLSSQLNRLSTDFTPSRPTATGRAHSGSDSKEAPTIQRVLENVWSDADPFSLPAAAETRDVSDEHRPMPSPPMPTVIQALQAPKLTGFDTESWDQRLLELEGSHAAPPQILVEQQPQRSPVKEPTFEDRRTATTAKTDSFSQFEDLLSQIGQSAMQPPPKVVTEDLSSLSRRGESQPTINVTIGRVEVKATREQAPAPRPARKESTPAVMSLDDYLQRRAAGGIG